MSSRTRGNHDLIYFFALNLRPLYCNTFNTNLYLSHSVFQHTVHTHCNKNNKNSWHPHTYRCIWVYSLKFACESSFFLVLSVFSVTDVLNCWGTVVVFLLLSWWWMWPFTVVIVLCFRPRESTANEATKTTLLERQREYKMAALRAKKEGDVEQAKLYVKTSKVSKKTTTLSD